ncbi:F0F1 ATP synthase subunit gamma [Anopheles sinensis]|uniref:F0F1 ATP synthase subunit gamma n=1 Tax=Anopheles sinensis TaxID=74873 RepID=A0A084VE78_ANOSI|nr:F0F1 ATP synthase subunit gamma [Anopheles sinensis]
MHSIGECLGWRNVDNHQTVPEAKLTGLKKHPDRELSNMRSIGRRGFCWTEKKEKTTKKERIPSSQHPTYTLWCNQDERRRSGRFETVRQMANEPVSASGLHPEVVLNNLFVSAVGPENEARKFARPVENLPGGTLLR